MHAMGPNVAGVIGSAIAAGYYRILLLIERLSMKTEEEIFFCFFLRSLE